MQDNKTELRKSIHLVGDSSGNIGHTCMPNNLTVGKNKNIILPLLVNIKGIGKEKCILGQKSHGMHCSDTSDTNTIEMHSTCSEVTCISGEKNILGPKSQDTACSNTPEKNSIEMPSTCSDATCISDSGITNKDIEHNKFTSHDTSSSHKNVIIGSKNCASRKERAWTTRIMEEVKEISICLSDIISNEYEDDSESNLCHDSFRGEDGTKELEHNDPNGTLLNRAQFILTQDFMNYSVPLRVSASYSDSSDSSDDDESESLSISTEEKNLAEVKLKVLNRNFYSFFDVQHRQTMSAKKTIKWWDEI